jgi:hypothetical protein
MDKPKQLQVKTRNGRSIDGRPAVMLDAFPEKIGELIVIDWLYEPFDGKFCAQMRSTIEGVFWVMTNDPLFRL